MSAPAAPSSPGGDALSASVVGMNMETVALSQAQVDPRFRSTHGTGGLSALPAAPPPQKNTALLGVLAAVLAVAAVALGFAVLTAARQTKQPTAATSGPVAADPTLPASTGATTASPGTTATPEPTAPATAAPTATVAVNPPAPTATATSKATGGRTPSGGGSKKGVTTTIKGLGSGL